MSEHDEDRKRMRSELELLPDEREEAGELINELQDRLHNLKARSHTSNYVSRRGPNGGTPLTFVISLKGHTIEIAHGRGELSVSHGSKPVLRVIGQNIATINLHGLDTALNTLREVMILDDLANV